jgi:uncharacterized membrane protein YdjX (TVP38/TMEM64 family)
VGLLLLLMALAASLRWTPLGELLDAGALADGLTVFDNHWVRFLAVFLVIVVTSVLMVPLSALVVASALVLGTWQGFLASMAGALVSAAVAFVIGEIAGGSILKRYGQSRVARLSERLSDRGILTVALLRLIPVAPYTVVNVVAGASHLQLGKFLVGSAIGLTPGVLALTWFSGSLLEAARNPDARSLGILALVLGLIIGGSLLLKRLLRSG